MKYIKYKNYSNTYVFDTKKKWKTIWIFWWIHWNEIAWVNIIKKLIKKIESWKLKLLSWKLILVLCNEWAILVWQREIKYNLNRLFKEKYLNNDSKEYEIKRVKKLSEIIKEVDILFDIHSVSSKSVPFMFAENVWNEIKIASNIYNWKIVIWWGKIAWDIISWDTDSYAHNLWKTAFTIECWNHNYSKASEVGFNSSINLLKEFWLIKKWNIKNKNKLELIEMYKIKTTKTWNFKFVKWIYNFKEIKTWELIWYSSKEKLYAKEDFIILLPNYWKLKKWLEIFYFWRKLKI